MTKASEKLVVGLLATIASEMIVLGMVAPGWALVPPRLNTVTAVLAPLGHLGFRAGLDDWMNLVLTAGTWLLLGAYWTWSWIRNRAGTALLVGGSVYGLAIALAFLGGP
jgi:hypothetical protein